MKTLAIAGLMMATAFPGCTPATVQKAVAEGQLFCASATAAGPLVVALATAAGAPVIVTGATSQAVAEACAVIGAIPVSPPANPGGAPTVAAAVGVLAKVSQ